MATTKIPQELLEKTSITFADGEILNFGASNDLQIYHSGSYSYIKELGTNGLYIDTNGDGIYLRGTTGNKNMVRAIKDGAVTLYHNGNIKFYTNASGVDIVGTAALTGGITIQDNQVAYFGTGLDLRIYHVSSSGSNLIQSYTSGELVIESNGNTKIRTNNADDMAKFLKNGAVELYYDNVKKFETTSTGITVTGAITSNDRITGDGSESAPAFRFATDTNTGMFPPAGGDVIGFATGGAERVRIDSSGKVGIGTNSPAQNLHVEGAASIIHVQSTSQNQNASIWFNSNVGGTQANRWEIGTNISAGGDLEFFDRLNSASRMVIEPSGQVGIGTINPAAKLDVVGGHLRLDAGMSLQWDNSHERIEQSDGHLEFFVNNGEKMTLDTNGLGIGTTAPDTLLELRKDTASTGYGDYPTLSIRNDNAAGYGAIHFQEGSTQRARVEVGNNSGTPYMGLYTTSGASGITIKDGKVGIGTSSPSNKLHVAGVTNTDGIKIQGNQANVSLVIQNEATNGVAWDISSTGGGHGYGDGALHFGVAFGQPKMKITSAGSVGIGTNTPLRDFDVTKSLSIFGTGGYTELMLRSRAGTAQNLGAFHLSIRGDVGGNNDDLKFLRFTGGNSPSYAGIAMQIQNSTGNVGIGTSSPTDPLTIHNGTPSIAFKDTSSNGEAFWQLDGVVMKFFNKSTGGDMVFGTANNTRWKMLSTGHFVPNNQHTYDIGGTNAEVRNVYAQGISFASNANASGMSSELLDDYEEGTWTPDLRSGTTSLSTQTWQYGPTATYTKIGRLVYIHMSGKLSSVAGTGASELRVFGLPFTPHSTGGYQEYRVNFILGNQPNTSDHSLFGFIRNAGTDIGTRILDGGDSVFHTNRIDSNTFMSFWGAYFTD